MKVSYLHADHSGSAEQEYSFDIFGKNHLTNNWSVPDNSIKFSLLSLTSRIYRGGRGWCYSYEWTGLCQKWQRHGRIFQLFHIQLRFSSKSVSYAGGKKCHIINDIYKGI